MTNAIKIYLKYLFAEMRWKLLAMVGFCGIQSILEGLSLLALIPIFQIGTGNHPSGIGLAWFRWLDPFSANALSLGDGLFLRIFAFFLLAVSAQLAAFVTSHYIVNMTTATTEKFRRKMLETAIETDWTYYHSVRTGELANALLVEAHRFAEGVRNFLNATNYSVVTTFLFVVAFLINTSAALASILFALLAFALGRGLAVALRPRLAEMSRAQDTISVVANELCANLKFWKSSATETLCAGEFSAASTHFTKSWQRALRLVDLRKTLIQVMGIIFVSAILLFSHFYLKKAFVEMLVFLGTFSRIFVRFENVHNELFWSIEGAVWGEKLSKRIDDLRTHAARKNGTIPSSYQDSLVFYNVTFSYPGSRDSFLFNNVSLSLTKGKFIAVVGPSGSGKSTLLDLMTGLLKPDTGEIWADGVSLADVELSSWRKSVGLVLQESPLLFGTIAENIAWEHRSIDMERVMRCARLAHADDFIESFPKKYSTQVGEKGGRLSGGQRQRIALARALYRQPSLLILDEPTSSLDLESVRKINATLKALKGSLSILLVTHDTEAVQLADEVFTMQAGRLLKRPAVAEGREEWKKSERQYDSSQIF